MGGLSRRGVLLGSVAVGVPLLTGCGGKKVPGGEAGGGHSGATSPSAQPTGEPTQAPTSTPSVEASQPGKPPVVRLDSTLGERLVHLDVGPAVRVGQQTVVRLEASVDTGGTAPLSFGSSRLTDVYLLSLEQSLAWPVQDTSSKAAQGDTGGVTSPGKPLVVFPVFGALGEGLSRVQVLVPGFGVALDVPVVTPDQAGFDAQQVVSAAVLDAADKGPLPVEFFCGAADGSFDVDRGQDQVTVSLANDVTFAVDSAELSGQADSVLATVVTELGRYPSGGSLSIVGHTDDVADDAYNQTLSEKRAQAVHGRLGQLTDLSQWQVTVSGKGESEPRVPGTTEEARAANRRVELQVSPAKPEEA
ncbi:OmpA family protein [Actinomyces weissii]|uniref:OmpA family protein n=1 Tax=Actinomyces weissii TaxID=675090 RepID=UPI002277DEF8|nr:OmpA family protein [Actinomyces weissii]